MISPLRSLKPKQILRALARAGFYIRHQKGSHVRLFHHSNNNLRVTLPYHNKDIPIGTLKNILRQANLSEEEFLKFL